VLAAGRISNLKQYPASEDWWSWDGCCCCRWTQATKTPRFREKVRK
jgi:hypothetical protein